MERQLRQTWVITSCLSDGIIEEFDNKKDAIIALANGYEVPMYVVKACAYYADDNETMFFDYDMKKAIGKLKKYEFETVTIKQ